MRIPIAIAIIATAAACTDPAPQPQPNELDDEELVNATRVDAGVAPGALGNESVNYSEGSITPAERGSIYEVEAGSPRELVERYADLLERRQFDEAYRMWAPEAANFSADEFAQAFEPFETINAAVGRSAGSGAGGSTQEVQLTLSGEATAGRNYVVTGPVILTQVGAGPGAAADQGRWRIAKMVLTGNPRAADALIEQQRQQ